MKKIFIGFSAIIAIAGTGCSNGHSANTQVTPAVKDTSKPATAAADTNVKTIAVSYKNVDAGAGISIKEIVTDYLHIKNALASDNSSEAASAGSAMDEAIRKLNPSKLTTEQKKSFDALQDGMQEDAEHIGKNGGNIKHQREHFAAMSESVYQLVKAFGGGETLYHDHCPMYNENKGGALWLSETKEIKNPYLGKEMPTCGTVEEEIK